MTELQLKKGERVKHKYGHTGQLVSGKIRLRDDRVNVQTDSGKRLWCLVDFLEAA